MPTIKPATPEIVSNAEEFSYSATQASQIIGENEPSSIPVYLRFMPFMSNYNVQKDIDYTNDTLSGSRQSLLKVSQDSVYLLKFLFYAPAEEFATYGQNELLDDERIQRTKQEFQAIIDNPSLSDAYKQDILSAMDELLALEKNKDIKAYISSVTKIQSSIINRFNSDVNQEKETVNQLYNQLLYQ
jgi:hypothetical protein